MSRRKPDEFVLMVWSNNRQKVTDSLNDLGIDYKLTDGHQLYIIEFKSQEDLNAYKLFGGVKQFDDGYKDYYFIDYDVKESRPWL